MRLKKTVRIAINFLIQPFNLQIVNKSYYKTLFNKNKKLNLVLGKYKFISKLQRQSQVLEILLSSESQLNQDLFVLYVLNFKSQGFFVEFGATNGKDLSNTYMLEKLFEWNGILSEPNSFWHKELEFNRSCILDFRAVHKDSDQIVVFKETESRELATLKGYGEDDLHSNSREKIIKEFNVETISLNDLLKVHNAPRKIDYISIDTEGSEYDILENFDFAKYEVLIWTIEHAYSNRRDAIYNLMSKNGYKRVESHLSAFDDWYILEKYLHSQKNLNLNLT